MLTGMIEVHDENRSRELHRGQIPDPDGAVPQNHLDARPCPTPLVSLAIDTARKLFCGLDSACVGCGIWVANRTVLRIDADRGEYAAQFDFASVLARKKSPCRSSL
jgi:hypothetical protein